MSTGQGWMDGWNKEQNEHSWFINEKIENAILKKGTPISLSFYYRNSGNSGGGHTVAVTQLLTWNNHNKYMIWDNNYPFLRTQSMNISPYLEWYQADGTGIGTINFENPESGNGDKIEYELSEYPLYLHPAGDSQNIYNLRNEYAGRSSADRSGTARELTDTDSNISYFPTHISVMTIGTEIDSVTDNGTNQPITLIPNGELLPDQAVIETTMGGIFNFLYLPVGKIYRINATKYAEFVGLKIFVTTPNADGTVTRQNYENVETAENDPTKIWFLVGQNNTDKNIYRSPDGTDFETYPPDYDAILETSLGQPEYFKALHGNGTVTLNWKNTAHPGLSKVQIVKSDSTYPQSNADGTVIYQGLAETFTDTAVQSGKHYYYAAFSVDVQGNASSPAYADTDTSRYTIYGRIATAQGQGIPGIQIAVKSADGQVLDADFSDANGNYVVPNLENGEYTVEVSADTYLIQGSPRTVTINNANAGADFTATEQAALFFTTDITQAILGNTIQLQWAYRNIANEDLLVFEMKQGDSWQTVQDNIPAVQGQVQWKVIGQAGQNANLRIVLKNNPAVFAEITFAIIKPEPGDINFSGARDLEDVILILQVCVGISNDDIILSGDPDGDNRITVKDAIFVLQETAGMRE